MTEAKVQTIQWYAGAPVVMNRNPVVRLSGIDIVENAYLPKDTAFVVGGKAMLSAESIAKIAKVVSERADKHMMDAILGVKSVLPKKPDPEVVAMESNQLWGAF